MQKRIRVGSQSVNRVSAVGAACVAVLIGRAAADGPADNIPDRVRPIPPPGIEVPGKVRDGLVEGVARLRGRLVALEASMAGAEAEAGMAPGADPRRRYLPDVEIHLKAVEWALEDDGFHHEREFAEAGRLLEEGIARAEALLGGDHPWTRQSGPVVRGYRSRIDGSVQPYGIVVPGEYGFDRGPPHRLDFWFHGRGEKLTELAFLVQRGREAGPFTPPGAIVLHPYGRYSNANKFAGEVDLFEALEHAAGDYRIDRDRLVVRGFSMGGAACWQFAVHHADRWAAAQPGAGFAETREFLRFFQDEDVDGAPWFRKRLWHWYDCPDWVANLAHCPVVAYSGENDRQKQAADVMAAAMAEAGMDLVHVIGPGMGHGFDDGSKVEIERRITALAERGRERMPRRVRFTTWTLRYPSMHWVRLEGLRRHWERADVRAEIAGDAEVTASTRNVDAIVFSMGPGQCPLDPVGRPRVVLDGVALEGPPVRSDLSWRAAFVRGDDGRWTPGEPDPAAIRKRPGLQGPVDDAFMDAFLFVRPTGVPLHAATGRRIEEEFERAVREWRRQFRGDVRVVDDTAFDDALARECHVVLWGDPGSNAVLARILDRMPLRWDADALAAGGRSFDARHHFPVLVRPNPLNPDRYIVLNSGPTYREYDYLNNARQVPRLPDWAIIDARGPATTQEPGTIAAAGFFDERWEWGALPPE